MQDLGAYGVVAQSLRVPRQLGDDGALAPGLAESWEPNEDGTVWTFQLREGVKWQDGTDFTSADVAATMDRLVVAENSGLAGVIAEGAVDTTDPRRCGLQPRGAQRQPAGAGLVLQRPDLHHPGRLRDRDDARRVAQRHRAVEAGTFDAATGCTFERNPDWWGGQTPLDGQEYTFFDDLGTMLTAMQGGAVDALIQFSVHRRRRAAQRPELQRPGDRDGDAPPDLDALRRPASSSTRRRARRWR